jgi:hypothetical protein
VVLCLLLCNICSNWWPLTSRQTLQRRSMFWPTLSRTLGEIRIFRHAVRTLPTRPSSVSKGPYKRYYRIDVNGRKVFRYTRISNKMQCYTVVCSPDDGWKYQPKHVDQFPDINKLCNIASCWIYEYIGILLGACPILHISRIKVKFSLTDTSLF